MASHEELHTYLKQAVLELEKTRRRLREIEDKASEPIAIVGMACRYPGGVSSPADLWRAVSRRCDLVSGPPADRGWELENTDGADSHIAGFVHEVTAFDADFFGISTREAAVMDPQQRLALEASWEAFERAGIDSAAELADETGVFLGMASFTSGQSEATIIGEPDSFLPFAFSGRASSMAAGRVSYFLGFHGPAITLDTACSSSLTAIHEAVQSLRSGECPLALAGGVTVMTPQRLSGLRQGVGSAADGRCKSFAASADGAGWGEGVGMLLLERLSDAQQNQHPVLAVIRGSAVNHDGSSNRAGAPNRLAQQRVIRRALANAGLVASQVDVVEAHSTGTPLGDLTEVEALIETYGRHRPDGRPLWLGSLKSNINHTLAAAGVGGVIKMVESMRRGVIPPTLHSGEPTPFVDWSSSGVQLVTDAQPWLRQDDARRAGVSAFGISGVNAHVILEEAPRQAAAMGQTLEGGRRDELPVFSWVLSAKSAAALPMQAARLAAHLDENPNLDAADIGHSLATTRTQFPHRAVIVGRDKNELLDGLRSLATGDTSTEVVRGVAENPTKTAVMFPGEGAQSVGMGQQLYASFPQYAKAFDEVCAIFDELLGTSLQDVVFAEAGSEAAELLSQPAYAQPALFAFEVALFRLAESWGLRPDFVIGHRLGEVTAAYVAGVWSLDEACQLVAERGRLQQSIRVDEGMLAVEAAERDVLPFLREFRGCAVAAVDSPTSVTISGDHASLTKLAEKLAVNGMQTKQLGLSHPSHSANLEPRITELAAVCRRLTYRTPSIGVISAATGGVVAADQLTTPQYWVDQLQQPADIAQAVQWAQSRGGMDNFLEIGPGADLTARIDAASSCVTALLRLTPEETTSFVSGLATMFVHGTTIDWSAGYACADARRIELPTYAFQRRPLAPTAPASTTDQASVAAAPNITVATPKVHRSESRQPLRTATERTLAAAMEQILGVTDVGRDERFVALGGDSVSAMQLAHRMHAAHLPLNPQLIFEHPTLGELAAALDELAVETAHAAEQAGRVAGDGRFQAMSMSGLSAADLLALPDMLARIDKAAVA
ncbi:acyltransferase domain-containing protein [Mycobacterium simiae]|uniref:Acyltransferase domain-containing protein n=1 Tax=Mycobacterium simiae TaxID=1784 RepID=A0A5B1BSR0_MYCSI|nr:type I polyketide synthase [Mycobacterium simiae]KAA1250490.1 acyltransferase domain-containing protein [Mycobacterium simiae]